jgi:hypothetical protein
MFPPKDFQIEIYSIGERGKKALMEKGLQILCNIIEQSNIA